MGEGWQLMQIRGIPLRVHPSWFIILVLFTLAFQQQAAALPEGSGAPVLSWLLGLATALLLFVSVLLHELGHSLVALREGVKVNSITLFLLGGVARVERECSTPMGSFRVAAAGPAVSFALAGLLLASQHAATHANPLLGNLVGQLGALNLVLAVFNLLPGLPLDGGLILKALVWQFTGSQRRGIQVATATGRLLSLSAIMIGVYIFLRGGGFTGLWLVMLGWFGMGASRSQSQTLALQQLLINLRVGPASSKRYRVLEADQSLRSLSQMRLRGAESESDLMPDWVLVCRSGRWLGYVTDQPLKDLSVQYWDRQTVGEHMRPLAELPSLQESAPLWKAVLALEQSEHGRLLVTGAAGLPSGTLDRSDVGEAVLKGLSLKLPPPLLEASRRRNDYPFGLPLLQAVMSMRASGLLDETSDSLTS
ncbi:site-2 protease family protein [Synechococcus sp. ROS8604]|uniref:site-2 protease family protein n=1 Tax=Synechococcus sp. ROS8604 TaxID=1442557 RepID=UPI001644DD3E|nr:site-2 protease family protein [Synechococcus sp. ROS8604]QNI89265.1 metallopeptidase M50 family protein [Synechococcus sp. ROS8604]